MDSRLLPLVTLLYILSFLDRVNIGNAKLANIEDDLNLTGNQYNWSLAIFFIGYVLFEVPSNIILAKTKPSIWIPTIMVGWGVAMTLMALVTNFQQLMTARFFLGAFEAGLLPGIVFFITMWYIRSEQNYRIGIIYAGATLAGAFSGLIAYFIMDLDGKIQLSGWQWIFLIDGSITILIALLAYFFISDYPETAKFLTNGERALAIKRLKYDAGSGHLTHFEKEYILAAIKDWKVWSAMFIYIGIVIPVYSFSFFIPAILLSAPPFILGSISTIIIAIISDRLAMRGKYTGACIVGIGIFPSVPTSITWLNNNLAGNVKRATGSAMMIAFGNIGGAIASQIYQSNDSPEYINDVKIRNPEQILAGKSDSEIRNLGDSHPTFIYSL
ncbi:5579_t:CDS:10 [Diversispora eburnea]|uniref:5579_t:CDS:1 n=1 Tax=Diversispora eburnea TaxID=1213867 RepID=A0A9N8YSZ8_9GLOM|nr:5579_t:CDS:10 [Diversispora eburnea]